MNNLPPYKDFPNLENENILLKEIEKQDIPTIKSITSYNRVLAKDEIEAWDFIKKIKNNYNNGLSIHWGIFEKQSNQIIGTCGYYRGFENKRGELGCILLPDFRAKGFMKQALQLAINFGYTILQLNEIYALTNNNNIQAKNLLNSLNFELKKKIDEYDIEIIHQRNQ